MKLVAAVKKLLIVTLLPICLNVKDPLIGGNVPAYAQPSSDYEEQDDISISSKREKLEGKSAEKKKNEELFSSNDETKSNSIIDDIIRNLDLSNLDVKNVKNQLVSKSMEAFWLDNSEELLTDAIHKSAVVVSETGEESTKCQWQWKVHQTLHCRQLSQIHTQKQNWLLFGKRKRRSKFMTLLIL